MFRHNGGRRSVLSTVLGVAASVLLLASCAGEDLDQPATLPTKQPSPTTTSASPTMTVEQEVEAFVRDYYAELTHAAQTNDTSKLKTMSFKGCPCYRAVRVIERGAKQGELAPDAAWTVRAVNVGSAEHNLAVVDVKYDVSAYRVLDSSEKEIARFPAQRSRYRLYLVKLDAAWVIQNVVSPDA